MTQNFYIQYDIPEVCIKGEKDNSLWFLLVVAIDVNVVDIG